MTNEAPNPAADDLAAVGRCKAAYDRVRADLAEVIVGQNDAIEQVLIAVLVRGHALLEGVPGLAKALLLSSLAEAAQLSFKRILCTPDLLASDIAGAHVIQEDPDSRRRHYQFVPGPLFANMLLADDINRTPPKTQAAMLEAMDERQISSGGQVYKLPEPFFLLATQNPLEQEGGYPLPAGHLDRFSLFIKVGYPGPADEWKIARRFTSGEPGRIIPSLSGEELMEMQKLIERLPVSDQVLGYATALVRATRPGTPDAASFVDKWVAWGVGPRGLLALITCAKARAVLHGRPQATVGDVQWLLKPVLRHRIAGNYAAQASNLDGDRLLDILVEHVPADEKYGPTGM
jgi:MoxR-like ATPase